MNPMDFSLLLALLHAHGGTIIGRHRFQKLVCIMRYGRQIPFSFEFIRYHYGPYSESLSSAIDTLVGVALFEEQRHTITDHIIQYSYSLTEEGERLASSIIQRLRQEDGQLAERLITSTEALQETNFSELVRLSKEVYISPDAEEIIYQQ